MTRLLILLLLSHLNTYAPTPFTHLCITTSFLSHQSQTASVLHNTEVSAFHGGGLVCLPSLASPISLGSQFINKLFLTLFIAFLIL